MTNDLVKGKPKGPGNRRPPKKQNKEERTPTSPLEENPMMVRIKLFENLK